MRFAILCAAVAAIACSNPAAPRGPFPITDLVVTHLRECDTQANTLCEMLVEGRSTPGGTIWSLTGGLSRALPVGKTLADGRFSSAMFMRFFGGRGAMYICAALDEPVYGFAQNCVEYRSGF